MRNVRVAVVDIGTNSTRLLVADAGPGGVTELARESKVTRLGEGVDATGRLGDGPQERVFAVLERYAEQIAAHDCEASTAVMTSAVRDAENGAAFRATVSERFGLEGRTLSGDEEARFTFEGATARRPDDDTAERVVIDIGGGSTELVCGAGHDMRFHVSTQIGVVRFSERYLHTDPPRAEELDALAAAAREGIADRVPEDVRRSVGAAIAVAGTATSCASIDLALDPYDADRVEGHVLSRERLGELSAQLAALPLDERRDVTGLDPDRAPTIVAGVVILGQVLDAFGVGAVEISDRDILWGVALELASEGP